jgi:hypothetical protein
MSGLDQAVIKSVSGEKPTEQRAPEVEEQQQEVKEQEVEELNEEETTKVELEKAKAEETKAKKARAAELEVLMAEADKAKAEALKELEAISAELETEDKELVEGSAAATQFETAQHRTDAQEIATLAVGGEQLPGTAVTKARGRSMNRSPGNRASRSPTKISEAITKADLTTVVSQAFTTHVQPLIVKVDDVAEKFDGFDKRLEAVEGQLERQSCPPVPQPMPSFDLLRPPTGDGSPPAVANTANGNVSTTSGSSSIATNLGSSLQVQHDVLRGPNGTAASDHKNRKDFPIATDMLSKLSEAHQLIAKIAALEPQGLDELDARCADANAAFKMKEEIHDVLLVDTTLTVADLFQRVRIRADSGNHRVQMTGLLQQIVAVMPAGMAGKDSADSAWPRRSFGMKVALLARVAELSCLRRIGDMPADPNSFEEFYKAAQLLAAPASKKAPPATVQPTTAVVSKKTAEQKTDLLVASVESLAAALDANQAQALVQAQAQEKKITQIGTQVAKINSQVVAQKKAATAAATPASL